MSQEVQGDHSFHDKPGGGVDYVVVARRYRPQGFDELIGQQHVAQALKRAIESDRVGHAYLFTGARGVGKTSAARILAKALNCERGPTITPCNECDVCLGVAAGSDVDVLEIDGASNRGIDDVRQLRQNVAIRPSRARYKIYIIDEVHMVTKDAFNALLKTLEEPPEHVKFIFATTEANKIPITILSRCQRFDFAGIESSAIQARLAQIAAAEGVEIETDALQILAMRASGSMRDSQSLLEQLLSGGGNSITAANVTQMLGIAPAARLSQLVLPLANRDAATALAELDAAIVEGADVSQLVDQLLGYFRDVMTQAVGCDESRLLYALPSQWREVREIAQQLGVQMLLAIVQVLDQAAARMRVSTHTRTLAEMAVVRICSLENLDELASLIEQLRDGTWDASGPAVKKNSPASPAMTRTVNSPNSASAISPALSVESREVATETNGHPPEPDATAAAIALTAENVEQVWKQALELLTGIVAENASHVDEVSVDSGGRLQIMFSDAFYRDACERPGNRTRLEAALQEVCGQRVPMVFQARQRVDAPAVAVASAPSRRQQQADVAAQPFVKKALELFGGEPHTIRYVPPAE
ncbi:MAG: DNA polymerase III subunit gamma/tau [Bythopirellula sp.]|nr:DNA polymerase III subunit gamma/tau [Bythopirellula sp.]